MDGSYVRGEYSMLFKTVLFEANWPVCFLRIQPSDGNTNGHIPICAIYMPLHEPVLRGTIMVSPGFHFHPIRHARMYLSM